VVALYDHLGVPVDSSGVYPVAHPVYGATVYFTAPDAAGTYRYSAILGGCFTAGDAEIGHLLESSASFTFEVIPVEHTVEVEVEGLDPAPPYTPGQPFTVRVAVRCVTAGCDLGGKTVSISPPAASAPLGPIGPDGWCRASIAVSAPEVPGRYEWYAVFPTQDPPGGEFVHLESKAPFTFTVEEIPPPPKWPLALLGLAGLYRLGKAAKWW